MLPFLAIAAPAAVKGISSLLAYSAAKRNRTPAFGNTAQGKYLRRVGKEGMFSPTARTNMMSRQAGLAGTQAFQRKTASRGWLESRGMGKSIAGRSLIDSVDASKQKTLSDYQRDLDTQNELSRESARAQYAGLADANSAQRRAESAERNTQLVQGLGGAVMSGLSAYAQSQPFKVPDNFSNFTQPQLFEWAQNAGVGFDDAQALFHNTRAEQPTNGGSVPVTAPRETSNIQNPLQVPQTAPLPDYKQDYYRQNPLQVLQSGLPASDNGVERQWGLRANGSPKITVPQVRVLPQTAPQEQTRVPEYEFEPTAPSQTMSLNSEDFYVRQINANPNITQEQKDELLMQYQNSPARQRKTSLETEKRNIEGFDAGKKVLVRFSWGNEEMSLEDAQAAQKNNKDFIEILWR